MNKSGSFSNFDPAALRERYLAERDKRLHQGNRQYLGAEGPLAQFAEDPYSGSVPDREAVDREVDVVVVGGGFGGLLTSVRLRDHGVEDIVVIEQGADFGGTWYWNRYPGIRCDIESYVYMPLLEEVGTVPTERYATGDEIFEHCRAIGRHYRLYDDAIFSTKVTKLQWSDPEGRWLVETDRGDRLRARFVAVGQGPLAKVKLPAIPGITEFAGKMFHTARWDYSYTGGNHKGGQDKLADKRVAVIGTAATAIQIIPKLAETTGHLFVFQRTPSAIDERNNAPTDFEWYESQAPGWQKLRRDNFLRIISGAPHNENLVGDRWTDFHTRIRAAMAELPVTFDKADRQTAVQRVDYEKMEDIRARVSAVVKSTEIAERLKPWYNYLCKRPLFSDDFLEVFERPNVTLVDTEGHGIDSITHDGIVAGGKSYPVDCIIFATGFDVGAPPYKIGGYEVIGRDGISLETRWSKKMRTLHGTQTSGFPNLHIVGAVQQGTIAFNFTHTLDIQATHAADQIGRCLADGIRSYEVTEAAEDEWFSLLHAKHIDHDQFDADCTPGFLNNEGDTKGKQTFVGGAYGGGPIEYEALITKWRNNSGDDVKIKYFDR